MAARHCDILNCAKLLQLMVKPPFTWMASGLSNQLHMLSNCLIIRLELSIRLFPLFQSFAAGQQMKLGQLTISTRGYGIYRQSSHPLEWYKDNNIRTIYELNMYLSDLSCFSAACMAARPLKQGNNWMLGWLWHIELCQALAIYGEAYELTSF